jgi:small basic protein (TIGR04137 family)
MSIHPSLASASKSTKQRSVLKRTERLRSMMEKNTWKDGDKVFGLPKIKAIRIKMMKKEKAADKPAEGAAAGAAPAAGAKEAAAKAPAKK